MFRQNRMSGAAAVLVVLLLSLVQIGSATAQPPPKDPNNYVPGLTSQRYQP